MNKLVFRLISFKPSSKINFVGGKFNLVNDRTIKNAGTGITTVLLSAAGYIGYKLIKHHATMGWFSICFHSFAFFPLSIGFIKYLSFNRKTVHEMNLLEPGTHVELCTNGLFGRVNRYEIKISDILNVAEDPKLAAVSDYMKTNIIASKHNRKNFFLVSPSLVFKDEAVANAIMRGEDIQTSDIKSKNEDPTIIDI